MKSDAPVLVVEDNIDLRELYGRALRLDGFEVIEAGNGRGALTAIRDCLVKPFVILLDLMMPVMDGWEFLEERRHDLTVAGIPVVVCSAAKDNLPVGLEFVKKPVDLDALIDLLGRHPRVTR